MAHVQLKGVLKITVILNLSIGINRSKIKAGFTAIPEGSKNSRA